MEAKTGSALEWSHTSNWEVASQRTDLPTEILMDSITDFRIFMPGFNPPVALNIRVCLCLDPPLVPSKN